MDQLSVVLVDPSAQRRRRHPRKKWEELKDEILDLRKSMTLAEIRCAMMETKGFDASESEYKHHFKVWKSRKNFTKADRQVILRQVAKNPSTVPKFLSTMDWEYVDDRKIKNLWKKRGREAGLDMVNPIDSCMETTHLLPIPPSPKGQDVTTSSTQLSLASGMELDVEEIPRTNGAFVDLVDLELTTSFPWQQNVSRSKLPFMQSFCSLEQFAQRVLDCLGITVEFRYTSRWTGSARLIPDSTQAIEPTLMQTIESLPPLSPRSIEVFSVEVQDFAFALLEAASVTNYDTTIGHPVPRFCHGLISGGKGVMDLTTAQHSNSQEERNETLGLREPGGHGEYYDTLYQVIGLITDYGLQDICGGYASKFEDIQNWVEEYLKRDKSDLDELPLVMNEIEGFHPKMCLFYGLDTASKKCKRRDSKRHMATSYLESEIKVLEDVLQLSPDHIRTLQLKLKLSKRYIKHHAKTCDLRAIEILENILPGLEMELADSEAELRMAYLEILRCVVWLLLATIGEVECNSQGHRRLEDADLQDRMMMSGKLLRKLVTAVSGIKYRWHPLLHSTDGLIMHDRVTLEFLLGFILDEFPPNGDFTLNWRVLKLLADCLDWPKLGYEPAAHFVETIDHAFDQRGRNIEDFATTEEGLLTRCVFQIYGMVLHCQSGNQVKAEEIFFSILNVPICNDTGFRESAYTLGSLWLARYYRSLYLRKCNRASSLEFNKALQYYEIALITNQDAYGDMDDNTLDVIDDIRILLHERGLILYSTPLVHYYTKLYEQLMGPQDPDVMRAVLK